MFRLMVGLAAPALLIAAAAADQWTGTYKGPFDGARGTVQIGAPNARGERRIDVDMVKPLGCSGGLTGSAVPNGNAIALRVKDDIGGVCKIAIVKRGRTLTLNEDGCGFFHGASCAFDGTATGGK